MVHSIAHFVKTMPIPVTRKEKYFTLWQEAKCKDVERVFGVLEKKFNCLVIHVRLFDAEDIYFVVKACIALHNMMVEVCMNCDEIELEDFYDYEGVNSNRADAATNTAATANTTFVDPDVQV